MMRAFSWIVVAIIVTTLAVSHTDAFYEMDLVCLGTSYTIDMGRDIPNSLVNRVYMRNGALVLRGFNLSTDVYVEDCNNISGGQTMVMNVSDPSTWFVVMPGTSTCWYTLEDDDQYTPGCDPVNGHLMISHISEHCGNVSTAEICNPLDLSAASVSVPVSVSVVVAVGVLIASIVIA